LRLTRGGVRDGDRLARGVEFVGEPRQLCAQPLRLRRARRRGLPFGEERTQLGLVLRALGDLLRNPSMGCLRGVQGVKPPKEISELCPALGGPCGYPEQAFALADPRLLGPPLRP
jgi:hypothetical protein